MSDGEIVLLRRELKEAQEKLCSEKHKPIDDTLDEFRDFRSGTVKWLIGIMSTTILTLLGTIVTLITVVAKK